MIPPEADLARVAAELELLLSTLNQRIRSEAPNEGVTVSQMVALNRLDRSGPETTSGLAAAEHVRPQSMAITVGHLEGHGFVRRVNDPNDGRRILIEITDEGSRYLGQSRQSRELWLTLALSEVLDDNDRQTLTAAIPVLDRLTTCELPRRSQRRATRSAR